MVDSIRWVRRPGRAWSEKITTVPGVNPRPPWGEATTTSPMLRSGDMDPEVITTEVHPRPTTGATAERASDMVTYTTNSPSRLRTKRWNGGSAAGSRFSPALGAFSSAALERCAQLGGARRISRSTLFGRGAEAGRRIAGGAADPGDLGRSGASPGRFGCSASEPPPSGGGLSSVVVATAAPSYSSNRGEPCAHPGSSVGRLSPVRPGPPR